MGENNINLKKQENRLVYIDLLKSIAIFFVIFYHGTLYTYDFLTENKSIYYLSYFIRTIVSTCVPLFLFINGYLLFSKEFNLKKHIKKMIKLIIITGLWGIITLILLQIIRGEYFSLIEFHETLWNYKVNWVNHLWYMGALVCIYCFYPILKQAYDTNKKIYIFFIAISALLTFGNIIINEIKDIFCYLIKNELLPGWNVNFFNMFNPFRGIYGYIFVYFCMGGLIYHLKEKIESISIKNRNIVSILGIFLSCFSLWGLGIFYSKASGVVWDLVWNGYDTIFTFCNVICIFILSLNWKNNNKCIRTISCNTLGIYFIHWIIIWATKPWLMKIEFLCNLPVNLIYAIAVLCVSTLISLTLKKIPILSKLV